MELKHYKYNGKLEVLKSKEQQKLSELTSTRPKRNASAATVTAPTADSDINIGTHSATLTATVTTPATDSATNNKIRPTTTASYTSIGDTTDVSAPRPNLQ